MTPLSQSLEEDPPVGEAVTITGWGRTSDASQGASQQLMYSDAPTIEDPEICAQVWGHSVTEKGICINTSDGGTCNGDSGGPLNYPQAKGTYVQVGVVSYGSGLSCEMGIEGYFTRVSAYKEWIEGIIANN